jgi:hypothetical protein
MPDRPTPPPIACAEAFLGEADSLCAAGAGEADADIDTLAALAERLLNDVEAWRQAVARLHVAAAAPLRVAPAARLLIECVFDEVLHPPAGRLLLAQLAWRLEGR